MEIFVILVVGLIALSQLSFAAETDAPPLFEWYKEIDGADALPEAYYVEEACVYWAGLVRILPDAPGEPVIKGEYPKARFFSIAAYHHDIPVDVLYDFQITPDPGSVNPYRSGLRYPADNSERLFYSVRLIEISGTEEIPEQKPSNCLYVKRHQGENNDFYLFLYRVYWNVLDDDDLVPDGYTRREWEKRGHKSLPEVVLEQQDAGDQGVEQARIEISDEARSRIVERFEWSRRVSALPGTDQQEENRWVIGNPKVGFGNSAAVYLLAHLDETQGEIALCRFIAPSFPNTNRGESIDPMSQQVRYWSVCTHIPGTMTTIACVSDYNFVVDDNGYATVAVSTKEKRPVNAINWLPYGWDAAHERYGALVFLRNLLPSETLFPESPYFYAEACSWFHSPESPDYLNCMYDYRAIAHYTGTYYPEIRYCSKEEFERYGHSVWEAGA